MFPRDTTDAPAHRTLAERLRDVFGTAIEFATLGEATLDETAPARVRYLHPLEVAGREAAAASAAAPSVSASTAQPATGGHHAAAPAHVREHPHRVALRRPSRPRRPGAVPPRPPVCALPVPPAPVTRPATGPAPAATPLAHRDTPRD